MKMSVSNIFGLRLLATVSLSFPARSIIRRAWFTRLKMGQSNYLRAIRHRRLALHREWDDEGQLHGLRAPQIGAEKRGRRVQENRRTQLRFMRMDLPSLMAAAIIWRDLSRQRCAASLARPRS